MFHISSKTHENHKVFSCVAKFYSITNGYKSTTALQVCYNFPGVIQLPSGMWYNFPLPLACCNDTRKPIQTSCITTLYIDIPI